MPKRFDTNTSFFMQNLAIKRQASALMPIITRPKKGEDFDTKFSAISLEAKY